MSTSAEEGLTTNPVCARGKWVGRNATMAALGIMLCICGSPLRAQIPSSNELVKSEHTVQSEPTLGPNVETAVDERTLTGRLTCAKVSAVSYTCGHSKNEPVWGCRLHCAKGPDGSQYVLQTDYKTYSVTGDPKQLRHFAADDVVVSGELSGDAIRAFSIAKPSRRSNQKNLMLEPAAR